jgi:murein DD-endopeptidase MepM/ murein hydrolase activator NlpD
MGANASCPSCGGKVDVKSRHVAVTGTAVQIYCSEVCLSARDAPPRLRAPALGLPRRRGRWIVAFLAASAAGLVLGKQSTAPQVEPLPLSVVVHALQPRPVPEPPTTVNAVAQPDEAEATIIDELAHDAWIHPLAGPERRMPIIPDAAFGALRAGDRPSECVSGHCGVDIGNTWGEPVHAVHDGVVDWVNRGPNDEHGGIFVKLSHRDGTLYTWYFHLAAVPHWVQPGASVKLGQVIGLLGDTGVGRSGPHLHFSLSVKPSKTAKERYIDPEPLIAIWPMWLADDRITMATAPGTPVRQDGWRPHPRRSDAKPQQAALGEGSAEDRHEAEDAGDQPSSP